MRNIIKFVSFVCICSCSTVYSGNLITSKTSPKAISAQLVFLPDTYTSATHIDEAYLKKFGCSYYLNNSHIASDLLNTAMSAKKTTPVITTELSKFEVRNEIFFNLENGKKLIVFFSKKFANLPYLEASWNGELVTLDSSFSDQIYKVIDQEKLQQANDRAPQFCGQY